MLAYRFFDWKTPARLVDVEVPEPQADRVLVKVAGNGICRSDLHLMREWTSSPSHLDIRLPMTVGHEIGGWVEALGPGVSGFEIGQPCLITLAGCGRCSLCAEGWNNYCRHLPRQPGMGLDGGLAEYVSAPAAGIVPLPGMQPWRAAPLTDAGLSSYHAVKRVLPLLVPGSSVVVIGVGGLGHLAVSILKTLSPTRVIALDPSEKALGLAAELGADVCFSDGQAVLDEIGQGQVDAVLDFVGAGSTVGLGVRLVRALGQLVVVGRGHGDFPFNAQAWSYGATVSTTFGGCKRELMELIALVEAGKLESRITRFPLNEVGLAFEKLAQGELVGRAVIIPGLNVE